MGRCARGRPALRSMRQPGPGRLARALCLAPWNLTARWLSLQIRNQAVMLTTSAKRQTELAGQLRAAAATGCRKLELSGDRSPSWRRACWDRWIYRQSHRRGTAPEISRRCSAAARSGRTKRPDAKRNKLSFQCSSDCVTAIRGAPFSPHKQRPTMRIQPKLYPVSRLLFGMFVLSTASLYSYTANARTDQPPIPRGVAMKSWQENGRDGQYLLQVLQGSALKAGEPVTGTVKSDTDCDADAAGLSHCHNIIELANGTRITVINTHNMHRNRCLGAGDLVSLTGISGPWTMGSLFRK